METSNKTYRYGRLEFHHLADVVHKFFAPFLQVDPDGEVWMDMPYSLMYDIDIVATDADIVPFRYPEDILRKQIDNLSGQILLYWREDIPKPTASDIAGILLDNAVRWEEYDHRVPIFIYDEVPEMLAEAYRRRLENV